MVFEMGAEEKGTESTSKSRVVRKEAEQDNKSQ
jgi:hypothetical protein